MMSTMKAFLVSMLAPVVVTPTGMCWTCSAPARLLNYAIYTFIGTTHASCLPKLVCCWDQQICSACKALSEMMVCRAPTIRLFCFTVTTLGYQGLISRLTVSEQGELLNTLERRSRHRKVSAQLAQTGTALYV